jgi:hypothetical protein
MWHEKGIEADEDLEAELQAINPKLRLGLYKAGEEMVKKDRDKKLNEENFIKEAEQKRNQFFAKLMPGGTA